MKLQLNFCSFWFIIKLQWAIEKKSIFSNNSHLEWMTGLSDTILKETLPRTIPARVVLIWFSGFRGEDLNVKVYNVWHTDGRWKQSDGRSSLGLWPRELIITWCVYESQSIIRRVISVSALELYIRYIYFWNLKFLNNFIIIMIDWFIVFNATLSNISAISY